MGNCCFKTSLIAVLMLLCLLSPVTPLVREPIPFQGPSRSLARGVQLENW